MNSGIHLELEIDWWIKLLDAAQSGSATHAALESAIQLEEQRPLARKVMVVNSDENTVAAILDLATKSCPDAVFRIKEALRLSRTSTATKR